MPMKQTTLYVQSDTAYQAGHWGYIAAARYSDAIISGEHLQPGEVANVLARPLSRGAVVQKGRSAHRNRSASYQAQMHCGLRVGFFLFFFRWKACLNPRQRSPQTAEIDLARYKEAFALHAVSKQVIDDQEQVSSG